MKTVYNCDALINEALIGIQDFGGTRYPEAAMYLLRGLRDFQIFHGASVRYSWQQITPIQTITLPDDYLNFVSVGVSIGGKMFTYTRDNQMIVPSDPLQGILHDDRIENEHTIRKSNYLGANGYNAEGYFKLDPQHNRIVLKQTLIDMLTEADRTEVLLGYVSTGIDGDLKNSYIPTAAANMIIAYIEWKLVASDPEKYPANFRADKRSEYELAAEQFDLLALPSIDELYDAIYETSAQSIRR